jgi:GGDEF domain-containing protein
MSTEPSSSLPAWLEAAPACALRAAHALLRAAEEFDPADPYAGAGLRAWHGVGAAVDPRRLVEYWSTRSVGNPGGEMRYRWELGYQHARTIPSSVPKPSTWRAWREAEQAVLERDRFAFETRFVTPILIVEHLELLLRHAFSDPEAKALLEEAAPTIRRDFGLFVQAMSPWHDTFALWCLVRRPRALAMLHPLAVAVAMCHAADAERGGVVLGKRFPFHEKPLVSASAQLGASLLSLGLELDLAAKLARYVRDAEGPAGAYADGEGRPDVLTTLVVVDLIVHVDPSFDGEATVRYLSEALGEDGLWRALGPEASWLTGEVLDLLFALSRPFADRFRWPFLADSNRDHKTGLPFYAYFADLARLFSSLPGLAGSATQLAFIDLAGFRAFNNQFGQDRGDDVLRVFATALSEVHGACAIRDGGDEFLVVGAPERSGLVEDLDAFRRSWPSRFSAVFGKDVPPVVPRILVQKGLCGSLVSVRERLGRTITNLKEEGVPGPHGVLREVSWGLK